MSIFDKSLLAEDRTRVVTQITVSSSGTVCTVPGERHVFHWHIYLALAPPTVAHSSSQSVLLDMIPTNPPTGTLLITSQPSARSRSLVKIELDIPTAGSPTVEQLIEILVEKGMHRYNFDDSGSGCLYWVFTVVQHLEKAGVLGAGASESLRAFHRDNAEQHPERHPLPIRQGTFYW